MAPVIEETLPKALQTQALTALSSSFGSIWYVGFGMFGSVGLLGYVWFGLVGLVWFGRFGMIGLVSLVR